MSAPVIQLDQVSKHYRMGEVIVRALDRVSLTVDAGEFVAVMGSSGSGKSTLMNIIGCLDRPTGGHYRLVGNDVSRLSTNQLARVRNQLLGFVFQHFNLLARTDALENVELPLLYAGVPTRERISAATRALGQVGLADRVHHLPSQLSGGQQQRVAIARAIVNHPRILLADEPTGNLDSRTSVEVMSLFQHLGATGITIVVVTHEPDIARFASRVITLKDGRIASDERQRAEVALPMPSPAAEAHP